LKCTFAKSNIRNLFAFTLGETSEQIYEYLQSCLTRHGLSFGRLVAFSEDNAAVNFGGAKMSGQNNVFHRLRTEKENLVAVGCPAHICHNAAKAAGETLSIDAESIIAKLFSYFQQSTNRHERLREFCEFVDTDYASLPTHTRTRWLTLLRIIERIIELWPALKSQFLTTDGVSRILRDFFTSEASQCVFLFLQSALSVFQKTILILEQEHLSLPEMLDAMQDLRSKLQVR
jgi:hypothetical protein